jgi:hypothetical protein
MNSKQIHMGLGKRYLHMAVFLILFGCVSTPVGTTVPENKRILLQKVGTQTGIWKAFEITMSYNYVFNQENIQLPGSIEFSGSLKRHTSERLERLVIWVDFLDAQGKILSVNSLYSIARGGRSFTVKLETPPGTAGMTFRHIARERRSKED